MGAPGFQILESIESPADVKELDGASADLLASEIREYLVQHVTKTGGHLASNLGVVELTIALHRVFDCPKDKIVWDVGHQSYVHKLLTGRRKDFDTIRQPGGLSGFTKRSESPYDAFGAGHSSTSVSAALGIAQAERLKGSDAYTVAVVGDGAFTGGMIHEALNNCGENSKLKLIVILNENEMSISKNIGRFAESISKIRTKQSYFRTKDRTKKVLNRIPLVGRPLLRALIWGKVKLKNMLYGSNYFEDLGLMYFGPVDGNDREKVEELLTEARKTGGSAVIHLKTKKGKGYAPAEENPDVYHAVRAQGAPKKGGFSEAFGKMLTRLAEKDERICAITAAMTKGTGLTPFREKFPERFFDVGIAEEHAVTFAAGLAADGMKPFFAVYSSFLQRGYDGIIHDAALQKLPVVFCIDRAGLNSGDGATHHGIFDVSYLSGIPGMIIFTPATYAALGTALRMALSSDMPCAVRYSDGNEDPEIAEAFYPDGPAKLPGVRFWNLKEDTDILLVCHGRIASSVLKAAKEADCAVALCELIKPYDIPASQILKAIPDSVTDIVTVEEEIRSGGFGINLKDETEREAPERGLNITVMAPEDDFVVPGAGQTVFAAAGVDTASILQTVEYIRGAEKKA